jgi:hypothetical protein
VRGGNDDSEMWNADAERKQIELDIALSWSQAQRLVWHSPAWNVVMATVARHERDLGRLSGRDAQLERIQLSA